MKGLSKLVVVALCGVITFWTAIAIQQTWVVFSPFWATCGTITGVIALAGWWILTAAFLDEE